MPSDKLLLAEHKAGAQARDLAAKHRLNADSVRGRINRQKRGGRAHTSAPPVIVELAAGMDALEDADAECASEAWNAEGGAWAALEALKALIGRMGQAT